MASSVDHEEIQADNSRHDEHEPLLASGRGDSYPAESQLTSDPAVAFTFKSESWLLLRYSIPLIATYLLQYAYTAITVFAAGHISADALAACSIGMTTMNIIGVALFEAMATALDTLCSQAYGSNHHTGVGLHIQRMLLFMTIAAIPIAALWVCSPWLIARLVRQSQLAVDAGTFLRISIIGIPGYLSFEAIKRFLQAQGNFTIAMAVLIICTPVNALLTWIFAFRLNMGLEGAALAVALANLLRPVLLLVGIIFFAPWSHRCWGGFSRLAFRQWGPMVRLSLAGAAVNLGEWVALEVVTFSTSYLSTDHLAAQTVLTTTAILMWHIPFSVSVAVTTRVGHMVGAGWTSMIRRAAVFYGLAFVLLGVFDGILVFALRGVIPVVFADDEHVRAIAKDAILAVAAFQLADAVISGCNGMLRGLGRQSIAGWAVFIVNYAGSVPLALWLELGSPQWGLSGVWIGLAIGVIVIVILECTAMKYISWQRCVDEAKSREDHR